MTVAAIDEVAQLQEAVRAARRILPVAGATKPALCTPPADDVVALDVSGLRGIVEYDPAELTLTALAGTPVAQVAAALATHGQYLPFDPPLSGAGATLGGVVAAGTSGPNAFRHGGVRDFVIGVQIVDGEGRLVSGGGRVVKNAAGFDLSKLVVGSLGRLGVLTRISFKVFPRPAATTTVAFDAPSLTAALELVDRLARGPVALDALDLVGGVRVLARIGGPAEGLGRRAARVAAESPDAAEMLVDDADLAAWREATDLEWIDDDERAVRVALTARDVPALAAALGARGARARYSLGGNLAWVAWPAREPIAALDRALTDLRLAGVVLTGPPDATLLGERRGGELARRIRAAIDPHRRFVEG